MEQSVHRPLSQSVFWLDRRVNSAIRERGRLDLLRRPRAPVVTDCYIDPLTRCNPKIIVLRTHKDAPQMRRDAEREIKELDKRKECLRQEVEEMEAATPSLPEGVRTLWKARNDGSREDTLGSDLEGLRSQISDLSSQIADVDRRADEIERGLPILRARCAMSEPPCVRF